MHLPAAMRPCPTSFYRLLLPTRSPPNSCLLLQHRTYTSKWKRRLARVYESSHYPPPPPSTPKYETYTQTGEHLSAERGDFHRSLTPFKNTSKAHPLFPKRVAFVPPPPQTSKELKRLRPIWRSRRVGLLAYKLGCMALWDEWGERVTVTVCQVDRCSVLEVKTVPIHGYEAVVLGCGYAPLDRQSKPNIGRYMKVSTGPKHIIKEFKCTSDALLPVGHEMSVRHFVPGQWVFVSGWTKPKGFLGVMKRWGFAGGNASHGTEHKAHSAAGSISQGKSVNIVWKFKKMAGHHGPDPRVVNSKVFRIESTRNLIFLTGSIPGVRGSIVKISDARGRTCAKNRHITLPFPTFVPKEGEMYPTTQQAPAPEEDPFVFPDITVYEHS